MIVRIVPIVPVVSKNVQTIGTIIWGAIHSTKISGISVQNSMDRFGPTGKGFEKTGPPFEVVLFSRSDRSEFWLNGSRPWKRYPDDRKRPATETTSIAWIELSSFWTIGTIVSILKRSYGNALRRLRRSGRSKAIPEVITPIPNFLAHVLHFKMAAENTELNTSLFMEEVQKYPAIYNKFSTDYKNKFIRMNIWKAIGEKFGLDAAEAEKKM